MVWNVKLAFSRKIKINLKKRRNYQVEEPRMFNLNLFRIRPVLLEKEYNNFLNNTLIKTPIIVPLQTIAKNL